MPAPTITLFASNTSPTGPQLDNNFLAYAAFGNIPCTVAGTNTLVLTPKANTPVLTQLTNYIQFSGIFAVTNTGAMTIQYGAFTPLNVYKDSPVGPVVLSGGECVAGNAFSARYDSTLNANTGGYHINTSTAFTGGTITNNVVLSGAVLSVLGGSLGASLTSTLLTGNSLSITAQTMSLTGPFIGSSVTVTNLLVGATASALTRLISGLGTLTYTVTPANQTQSQPLILTGAQLADSIALGLPASIPAGVGFTGFMAAAGTVTVRLLNPTAASIAAATLTIRATALGFT